MIELSIDQTLLNKAAAKPSSYAYIIEDNRLEEIFAQPGLCLKVSRKPLKKDQPVDKMGWGKVPLGELSRVQNIYAWYGLAPRVHSLALVNGRYAAQVVKMARSKLKRQTRAILPLGEKYGVKPAKNWDLGARNWVGHLFVDFSGLGFADIEETKARLVKETYTRRGKFIGSAYQQVPELGIKGQRDMEHRIGAMQLSKVDFKGKTVLDIGCNLGAFSRYAVERGAVRVVGIDKATARLAHEVANWLGYWTIDYLSLSLPGGISLIKRETGIEQFDIVFANAVVKHVGGYEPWITNLVAPDGTMFFEGHGKVQRGIYSQALKENFSEVVKVGETTDNYTREVFRCRR